MVRVTVRTDYGLDIEYAAADNDLFAVEILLRHLVDNKKFPFIGDFKPKSEREMAIRTLKGNHFMLSSFNNYKEQAISPRSLLTCVVRITIWTDYGLDIR